MKPAFFSAVVILLLASSSGALDAGATDDDWKKLAPLSSGERIFVAKLTKASANSAPLTAPPIWLIELELEPMEMLRGVKPDTRVFQYSLVQFKQPEFSKDKTWLVIVKHQEDRWLVTHLLIADNELIAKAKVIASLPVGWSVDNGQPVSPWAALGDKAWPKDAPKPAGKVCSKSGRPALVAGNSIELKVDQIIPPKVVEYQNPYGDGKFKVTVTNRSDKEVEVPALLSDGNTLFWEDSLVVIYNGEPKLLPGSGRATTAKPARLKAGESVSTTIDILPLDGLEQPGGSRLYFDFALGEKSTSNFFYFDYQLHHPMREMAIKKARDGKR